MKAMIVALFATALVGAVLVGIFILVPFLPLVVFWVVFSLVMVVVFVVLWYALFPFLI